MKYRVLLIGFWFMSFQVSSQSELILSGKDSQMIIRGTSSLHPWQCRAEQVSGQLKAELINGGVKNINSLVFIAGSSFIKSIKDNGEYYDKNMDKNVYKALDVTKHPNITFTFSRLVSVKPTALEVVGILKIAGSTKEISITAKAIPSAAGIIFEGKVPIKMTDYNIEPPTALFGTIKTGNEVSVEYKLVFMATK